MRFTIIDPGQLVRILQRVCDADEFRSDYGLRSLSRFHLDQPFHLNYGSVRYEPAEADCKIKGGNWPSTLPYRIEMEGSVG